MAFFVCTVQLLGADVRWPSLHRGRIVLGHKKLNETVSNVNYLGHRLNAPAHGLYELPVSQVVELQHSVLM